MKVEKVWKTVVRMVALMDCVLVGSLGEMRAVEMAARLGVMKVAARVVK